MKSQHFARVESFRAMALAMGASTKERNLLKSEAGPADILPSREG